MRHEFRPWGAEMPEHEAAAPVEVQPRPKLTELDVKGREIAGLEPVPERFSELEPGRDYKMMWQNDDIVADKPIGEGFIFVNHNHGELTRTVEAPHWRTVNEDINATYETPHGVEHYYEQNTKGVGYLKPAAKGKDLDSYADWQRIDENDVPGAYGLVSKADFFDSDDGDMVSRTAYFVENGLRCELYRAIAQLKNVYYEGELVSIADLRKQGKIPKSTAFSPYIGERLIKNNSRIQELADTSGKRQQELYRKALAVFQRELADSGQEAIAEDEVSAEYLRYMCRNVAGVLAFMHQQGYEHFMLHSANLSLAGELLDVGTMMHWTHIQDALLYDVFDTNQHYRGVRIGTAKDIRDSIYGLKSLLEAECFDVTSKQLADLRQDFFAAYDAKLEEVKSAGPLDQELTDVRSLLEQVFDAVVIKNKRLAHLKRNDINDWPI